MKSRSITKWVSWGLPVLAYVICFFHSLSMGVIRESLVNEFSMTESTFSMISTSYFYVYLLMQIPSGILVDTIGPRLTVAAGTMLSVIGSLLFAVAGSTIGLAAGRVLIGLGVSVIFISIIKLQSIWFREEDFNTMSGLTCFIGTMGGVVAQTPLAIVVVALGWRGAFLLVAAASAAISVLVFIFVKDHDKNLAPVRRNEKVQVLQAIKSILANKATWPPFLMYAGLYGTFVVISGLWGISYMNGVYGLRTIEASKYVSLVVWGSAFGAIAIGWISDRLKKRRLPVLVYSTAYMLLWAALVFVNGGKLPIASMMVVFFALGFFSQGFVLSWSMGKEVNDSRYVGMAASVINIGGFFGSIAVPAAVAAALDRFSGLEAQQMYRNTFVVVLGIAVAVVVFCWMIRESSRIKE